MAYLYRWLAARHSLDKSVEGRWVAVPLNDVRARADEGNQLVGQAFTLFLVQHSPDRREKVQPNVLCQRVVHMRQLRHGGQELDGLVLPGRLEKLVLSGDQLIEARCGGQLRTFFGTGRGTWNLGTGTGQFRLPWR